MNTEDPLSRRTVLGAGLLSLCGAMRIESAAHAATTTAPAESERSDDVWLTNATTEGSTFSSAIDLRGRKLGLRWDASSPPHEPPYPPNTRHGNGYGITVWGSVDGRTRNRVVELLRAGPQELNDREGAGNAFLFYQGSLEGMTMPFAYAIVEFTNLTGETLASNDLRVWTADASTGPPDVRVPLLGFWGELAADATPGDCGCTVEQQRDYRRMIEVIDATVHLDQPARVEYYEQSWNEMRLMESVAIEAGKQTAVRIRRGGFPRFSLTVRNTSRTKARCETVAIGRAR